jgi:predicted dehydrogenase
LEQPLDGVIVEGRVSWNLTAARMVLERGLPLLLEKPAGTDFNEFRHLVEMARTRNIPLQMAYLFRWMPAMRALVQRARRGDLGRIYHFRGRLPKELAGYAEYATTLSEYRGGIFFEMAGHLVDLMVTLLGRPRKITSFLAHHHTTGPQSFIDNSLAVFEFDHAHATIDITSQEVVPDERRIEVFGTGGAAIIPHLGSGHLANNPVQHLRYAAAGSTHWETEEFSLTPLQISDLREFAAVITGAKQPEFSLDHDLHVQETLLTASGMSSK